MSAIHSRVPYGGWRRVWHRPRRASRLVEGALAVVRDCVGAGVTVFKSRRSTPGSRATSRPAAAIRSTSTASKSSARPGLIHWAFRPF